MSNATTVYGTTGRRRATTDETVVVLAGIQGPPGASYGFIWSGTWSPSSNYSADNAVLGPDGYPYICIVPASFNEDPTTTPGSWARIIGEIPASAIPVVPQNGLAATNVQQGLEEVDAHTVTNAGALQAHLDDTADAHDASAVSVVPAGTIAATDVQAALVEVAGDAASALSGHTGLATGAHAASAIANTPQDGVAATTVQGAINELEDDYIAADAAHAGAAVAPHTNFQDRFGFALDSSNAYDCTLSYDSSTRILTIMPTGATFSFWVKGQKFTKTGAQASAAHANSENGYFIYYDDAGNLQVSTTTWDLHETAPVAYIYYSTSANYVAYEERHTIYRSPGLHEYLHATLGTQIDSGFALSGYTLNTDSDAAVTWGLASGVIRDEDIRHAIDAVADASSAYARAYRSGAAGAWVIETGQASPFFKGTTYLQYNQYTGATWQLTELASGQFVNYFIYILPSIEGAKRVICIPGQEVHATLAGAQAASALSMSIGTVLAQEVVAVYKLSCRCFTSYGGTLGKLQIQAVERLAISRAATITGASPTVHNSLSGRADADAHPASAITNTPAGTVAAVTVQAAIDELDSEKQASSAKDAANGYCGLDANARIANARLGTGGAASANQHLGADQTWQYTSRVIRSGANVPAPASSKNWHVFYAPVAMTINNIRAIHVGGTSVTLNVGKNGTSTKLRSADYTSTTSWADWGSLQNNTLAAGDYLMVMVVTVTGSVDQVAIQIEGTPTA